MIKKCLQLGFVLIGCSSLFAQTEKPSEIFWKNLEKHCGKAYEGKLPEHITRDDFAGKKLGFIGQEIGREINTLGSKANDANIQRIVVQMKDELEKIKEQLFNIL